jgi:GTP-binding protein EngB required for normal cell division
MKDIRTNAYVIKVAPLWEANTNTQFILDPIHYNKLLHIIFTKIDKSTTNEFKPSLKNVDENIDANLRIKKLSNVFSKCATNVCPINNLYHFIITILSCF